MHFDLQSILIQWGILALVVFFMAFVAWLVYTRSKKERIHQLFAWLSGVIILWLISNFMENEQWLGFQANAIFLKMDFAAASFLAYIWFLFCREFHAGERKLPRLVKFSLLAIAVILAALSFNSLVINSIRFEAETIRFFIGPLFVLYAIYVAGLILAGLYYLLRVSFSSSERRLQARYILIGFTIAGVTALTVNLLLFDLLPAWAARVGIYASFIMTGMTAYSMSRYRLFDTKIAVAEIVAGLLIIVTFGQLFLSESFVGFLLRLVFFLIVAVAGLILIRSVTHEHEVSDQLKRANVNLEALLKVKNEFLQIASHQLRTPVSVMRGVLDALLTDSGSLEPAQRQEFLKRAFLKSEKLGQVVDDVLSATEMDTPDFNISGTAKPLSLRELAEKAVVSHVDEAKDHELTLTLEADEPGPMIMASEAFLPQAITNLVDNAIKYTDKGGKIVVKVYTEDDKAVLAVVDTGMGVPPEDLGKLWDKFIRASNAKNMHTDGSGLGLFIVKKIVEGHEGGSVFAKSELGKGSTFGFKLPIIKENK